MLVGVVQGRASGVSLRGVVKDEKQRNDRRRKDRTQRFTSQVLYICSNSHECAFVNDVKHSKRAARALAP